MKHLIRLVFLVGILVHGTVWSGLSSDPTLRFEANSGQADSPVLFLARGPGFTLFLTATEAVFALPPTDDVSRAETGDFLSPRRTSVPRGEGSVVRMEFVGANPLPRLVPANPLAGTTRYLIGNDPGRHVHGVTAYGSVRYEDLYPGIDLLFHSRDGSLEYDFIVGPGADPARVGLRFSGPGTGRIAPDGSLQFEGGGIVQSTPKSYQEVEGTSVAVDSRFALTGDSDVHFVLGDYDRRLPLVIDPMAFRYSTYLGGHEATSFGDSVVGIVVDAGGAAYVTGLTSAAFFPADPEGKFVSGTNVFVAKVTPSGSALEYLTFMGGADLDGSTAIALDSGGSAIVVGYTDSDDFPLPPDAIQGNRPQRDCFVAKLSPTGSLLFSTYLGGEGSDTCHGVAVDPDDDDIYAVGQTGSADFPLVLAFQDELKGLSDAFIAKIRRDGTEFVFSSLYGGNSADAFFDAAVEPGIFPSVFVAGGTRSDDLPWTDESFQPAFGGVVANGGQDAMVVRIFPGIPAIFGTTYLGGTGNETAFGIDLDPRGIVYVTGSTSSHDFPTTPGAFLPAKPPTGGFTGFVAKLTTSLGLAHYVTYLGGDDDTLPADIAADARGRAWVVGGTQSSDYPILRPLPGGTAIGGSQDGFVTALDPAGRSLILSSFLGGDSGDDAASGIALQPRRAPATGAVFVVGQTLSFDFPVQNPLQRIRFGEADGFVAKMLNWPRVHVGPNVVFWADELGAERWDVVVGDLFKMRGLRGIREASLDCVGHATHNSGMYFQDIPAPGEGFFFLVRPIENLVRGTFDAGGEAESRDPQIDDQQLCILPDECAHDSCEPGVALAPACDVCVARICTEQPSCCSQTWDATCVEAVETVCKSLRCPNSRQQCPHGFCEPGDPMGPFCDIQPDQTSCADRICARDPLCCQAFWSDGCIALVETECGMNCD